MRPFPEDDDAAALAEEDSVAAAAPVEPDVAESGADPDDCLCDPYDYGNEDGCIHTNPEAHGPNQLGVDVEAAGRSVFYGGEGEAMGKPRRLVAFIELPDRRTEDFQARNLLRESDIREAMAKGARRLYDAYMQRNYNAIGYVFDPDQIEYDIARLQTGMDIGADTQVKHTEGLARTLVATVVIRRD